MRWLWIFETNNELEKTWNEYETCLKKKLTLNHLAITNQSKVLYKAVSSSAVITSSWSILSLFVYSTSYIAILLPVSPQFKGI